MAVAISVACFTAGAILVLSLDMWRVAWISGKRKFKRDRLTPKFNTAGVPMYYINMDKSAHRRFNIEMLMGSAGPLHRVRGPDARDAMWELAEMIWDDKDDLERGLPSKEKKGRTFEEVDNSDGFGWVRTYAQKVKCTVGELALTMAHLKAIDTAWRDGAEHALIMEDDVSPVMVPYWTASFASLLKQAHEKNANWQVIQLQYFNNPFYRFLRIFKKWRDNPDDFVSHMDEHMYGGAAYLVSREGMEKVRKNVVAPDGVRFDFRGQVGNQGMADVFVFKNFEVPKSYFTNPAMMAMQYFEGTTGVRAKDLSKFGLTKEGEEDNKKLFAASVHENCVSDATSQNIRNYERRRLLEFTAKVTGVDSVPLDTGALERNMTLAGLVDAALSVAPVVRWNPGRNG